MRIKEFFEGIEISQEEKVKARRFLETKGIEKHILLKESLLAWRDTTNIRYSEIATAYRYDKRIRNVLYKYISYLEEFYRAIIMDHYHDKTNQSFWVYSFKKLLSKNNMNNSLEKINFPDLVKQIQNLPMELKSKSLIIRTRDNISALITLRNAVMHNKFLILFRGFVPCSVDGKTKSTTLKTSILNLASFLPTEVRRQLLFDIDDCKNERNNREKTKWDLPDQIVIFL